MMGADRLAATSPWRVSVAPMLAWTDRHCRALHRSITRRTRLYTEMLTTGALLHGDVARHLDFDEAAEHPLALQLGGSEPQDLARCAKLALQWRYDEVNLNCGCPSERVQRGAFGACLMHEPQLVRDAVAAMRDAVGGAIPVTVKHRLGIGRDESYAFVRDFVGSVAEGGCEVFVVHARNAWLEGLSPKDNREIPPLRHDVALRLARDFPRFTFVLNGGLGHEPAALAAHVDAGLHGVMVGRAAYHEPAGMATWDARLWGEPQARSEPADDAWREAIEAAYVEHMRRHALTAPRVGHDRGWPSMARHMLGLWQGRPGARRWRQVWSDHRLAGQPVQDVAALARRARLEAAASAREGSSVASVAPPPTSEAPPADCLLSSPAHPDSAAAAAG